MKYKQYDTNNLNETLPSPDLISRDKHGSEDSHTMLLNGEASSKREHSVKNIKNYLTQEDIEKTALT